MFIFLENRGFSVKMICSVESVCNLFAVDYSSWAYIEIKFALSVL
jgi:hypothetical protein